MSDVVLAEARSSIFIAADPERVFDAWLDPAIAAKFICAGGTRTGRVELDPHEGGEFLIEMEDEDSCTRHTGRYLVIDRPRRLAFTWISPATEQRVTVVEIRFEAEDGGTRVELRHEGLLNETRAGQHSRGWQSILEKQVALFG